MCLCVAVDSEAVQTQTFSVLTIFALFFPFLHISCSISCLVGSSHTVSFWIDREPGASAFNRGNWKEKEHSWRKVAVVKNTKLCFRIFL